jgi:hypothetical protein
MADEIPEPVLIELGRLTWSAIHLEDLTDSLCHFVVHRDPREDRRPIGRKVSDALRELSQWEGGASNLDQIKDWLSISQRALEKRNALLHSVPLILFNDQGHRIGHALGEMPKANREYHQRRMDLTELREVRAELDAAQEDWVAMVRLADQHHP